MAAEFERLWAKLTLTEEEKDAERVTEEPVQGSVKPCLVGTLLTKRPFNKEAIIATFKGIWKLAKDMHVSALVVIQKLSSKEEDLSNIGSIIMEGRYKKNLILMTVWCNILGEKATRPLMI